MTNNNDSNNITNFFSNLLSEVLKKDKEGNLNSPLLQELKTKLENGSQSFKNSFDEIFKKTMNENNEDFMKIEQDINKIFNYNPNIEVMMLKNENSALKNEITKLIKEKEEQNSIIDSLKQKEEYYQTDSWNYYVKNLDLDSVKVNVNNLTKEIVISYKDLSTDKTFSTTIGFPVQFFVYNNNISSSYINRYLTIKVCYSNNEGNFDLKLNPSLSC